MSVTATVSSSLMKPRRGCAIVVSIETTIAHPRRGFIKLEDTVAVTDQGWEAFGDRGRGWNRAGARTS